MSIPKLHNACLKIWFGFIFHQQEPSTAQQYSNTLIWWYNNCISFKLCNKDVSKKDTVNAAKLPHTLNVTNQHRHSAGTVFLCGTIHQNNHGNVCILDHVLFHTVPFSCRSQVTSDTSGNVGLHIYFSTECSHIDLIEPAFSSLLLMQCYPPAARLLCNPVPITSPYFHYTSIPRQAKGVKNWEHGNNSSGLVCMSRP